MVIITNQRIRKLRRELDITQLEFAERIGVSRANIGKYETGISEPSAAVLSLICREFDVREEWLRNGEGEMFKPKPSDILDQLAYKYHFSEADYVLVEKFVNMRPEARQTLFDYMQEVTAAFMDNETNPYAPAYVAEPPQPMDETMEFIKKQGKDNAVSEMSVEKAEAEYIKSCSASARKKASPASSTTNGAEDRKSG